MPSPCPCTRFQAIFDLRWSLEFQSSLRTCYVSKVIQLYELGQLCCYYRFSAVYGAPIVRGQYSGGFLLYHPSADYAGYYWNDVVPKDRCCNADVGLCDIFQQRRPLQTCENYQLQELGKNVCALKPCSVASN